MTSINVRLDKSTKLKNGSHPIVLQVTWGTNVRRKRIKGFSCKKFSWDFENHCYLHSQRKNELLEQYEKKARRIADYLDEWDYKHFLKEFNRSEQKTKVEQKKLIAYCYELQKEYIKKGQISYSHNFKAIGSFLQKCFSRDMRIQDFGERELNMIIRKMDDIQMKGYNYLKYLQIVLSSSIQKGYSKIEDCPIKTKYSPNGYDINKRKGKSSKHIKKNRIKDLEEQEKIQVLNYYYTADIPKGQKKHFAYWVLSYKLFAPNVIDIALIKWDDIIDGIWYYNRSKTGIGNEKGKPVDEEAMVILREYDTGGKYILEILNDYDHDPQVQHKRLHNYKCNMRRSYKLLSKKMEFLNGKYITWYTPRYTAPTLALSKGVELNVVKTLMDHASIKTTSKYLGWVRDKEKLKEAMAKL